MNKINPYLKSNSLAIDRRKRKSITSIYLTIDLSSMVSENDGFGFLFLLLALILLLQELLNRFKPTDNEREGRDLHAMGFLLASILAIILITVAGRKHTLFILIILAIARSASLFIRRALPPVLLLLLFFLLLVGV